MTAPTTEVHPSWCWSTGPGNLEYGNHLAEPTDIAATARPPRFTDSAAEFPYLSVNAERCVDGTRAVIVALSSIAQHKHITSEADLTPTEAHRLA